jgi:serine phosphatase RsbU (regulator of sigma subunit)
VTGEKELETSHQKLVTKSTLQYAGAHNPLWIIRHNAEEIHEIKANKQPIGQFVKPLPYTTHTVELFPGDTFYVFTDGYADQFGGPKGKKFKSGTFKKLLLSIQEQDMDKQKEMLLTAFNDWKGSVEQVDDVCVIGVRV